MGDSNCCGRGRQWNVINRYSCPPTHPWRLPSALGRCNLLLNTHKHILPWTPFGFPYSPSAQLLLCSDNQHSYTSTHNHKPIPQSRVSSAPLHSYTLKKSDIEVWLPEQKSQADTEAFPHTANLKVKTSQHAGGELNIADHHLTIRWSSNKVLPKTEGSERVFF